MEKVKCFRNARVYSESFKGSRAVDIVVKDGKIHSVLPFGDAGYPCAETVDCGGAYLIPGFIDSHLHLPGIVLYNDYGVNLVGAGGISEYKNILINHKGREKHKIIRGYGWDTWAFRESRDKYYDFKSFLDETFPDIPVSLFSFDYHSCLCNQRFLDSVEELLIENGDDLTAGFITEENVYRVLERSEYTVFSEEEMSKAVLSYQSFLLSLGITSVQALMTLGYRRTKDIEVLHKLDQSGLLSLNCNLALTIYPYDDLNEKYGTFLRLKEFETSRLRLSTVKIYIDGVIENSSALLLEPYSDSEEKGKPIWDAAGLRKVCKFFDSRGVQIHAHAIGDGAVRMIAECLSSVLGSGSANPNRHTVTHLQMACDSDIKLLAKSGILCCLQPYWFPVDGNYYQFSIEKIGDRAFDEYKANSMVREGIKVSFSSDSPVTDHPNPFAGISMALRHSNKNERFGFSDATLAFQKNGAYQLFRENEIGEIARGFWADFILLDSDFTELSPTALEKLTPKEVYFRGEKMPS